MLNSRRDPFFINAGQYIFGELEPDEREIVLSSVAESLIANSDAAIDVLSYILSNPLKEWWEFAVQVVAAIGYPRNAAALPLVIGHACMGNDIAENAAIQTLVALEPQVLAPYLLDALFYNGKSDKYLYVGIWEIAWFLLDKRVGNAFVRPCGPSVVLYLNKLHDREMKSADRLIRVLEKIGVECASYALPTLLDLLSRCKTEKLAQQIRNLIATFPGDAVEPYSRISTHLEQVQEADTHE